MNDNPARERFRRDPPGNAVPRPEGTGIRVPIEGHLGWVGIPAAFLLAVYVAANFVIGRSVAGRGAAHRTLPEERNPDRRSP